MTRIAELTSFVVVSVPGGEQERRQVHHVVDVRRRSVFVLGLRQFGQDVVARLAPAVLDVGVELVVQPLQRVVRGWRLFAELADQFAREDGTELVVVLRRYAEKIGNDQQGERLRVVLEELACPAVDERVELLVGQPPHEVLVLLEALGRDAACSAVPGCGCAAADPAW